MTTLVTVLATALLSSSALAQTAAPPAKDTPAAAEVKAKSAHWRSSKLIGVNVYNDQNEKLGDINEIILDPSGKVMGYVVGVGGFLGMGEHDILIEPAKIKFVNEPVRAASNAPSTGTNVPATGTNAAPTNTRNASNTGSTAQVDRWYPDHGVLSATKDQLKALPQFKYSATN
jgi:hypothetical protein